MAYNWQQFKNGLFEFSYDYEDEEYSFENTADVLEEMEAMNSIF